MRKLSLVIAAVLAGTMIFGASAFAAGSSTTTTTTAPTEENTAAHSYSNNVSAASVVVDGAAASVVLAPVSVAKVNEANAQAKAMVAPTAQVLHMIDVEFAGNFGKATITFNVGGVVAGQKIMVLHQLDDGSWEKITPDAVGNGTVTVTFTNGLSPVAFVAYDASAKTADVAPYAMIMAMIAVMGAAVCAKKAFN